MPPQKTKKEEEEEEEKTSPQRRRTVVQSHAHWHIHALRPDLTVLSHPRRESVYY
jgi:hypothetical protein